MEQNEINRRADYFFTSFMEQKEINERAEDVANQIVRKIVRHRHILRHLAR